MTVLAKWDFGKHEYVEHEVPDSWHVSCFETDMDTPVNCAQCGRRLPFGEAYTSRQVQRRGTGFGYAVCGDCHEREFELERKAGRE